MTRKHAREAVLHLLYALTYDGGEVFNPDSLSVLWQERRGECELYNNPPGDEVGYIADLVTGVTANDKDMEITIAKHSVDWRIERMTRIAVLLMKMALYEMHNIEGVTPAVAINEAVELCKRYDSEETAAFINGILGSIVRKADKP
jgi:N utilization substance protein B